MAITTHTRNCTTTTGNWVISEGHVVTYTTTTETGYFARRLPSSTTYNCTCGKSRHIRNRALKSDLAGHDEWATMDERAALLDAILNG